MYNPLQFFKPTNMRFDQAGQMFGNIVDNARLDQQKKKQQAGSQRFLGLQQLGKYQPKELETPIVQGQMEQARMDMLGGGRPYLDYQMKKQQAEANELYRKRQLEAKNKADNGTPKIAEYIGLQTNAIENAENVLQGYLTIENPTAEQKEQARLAYGDAWKANRGAMAKLGGHAKATGQDYTKLPTWGKALKDGITYSSADELNKALVKQANSRANLLVAQESDVYGEIKRKKTEFSSKMEARKDENKRKALSDQKLVHPDVYQGIMDDAKTAKKEKNIYSVVKLLANVIEPGMNVADTEVAGYLQGGENRLSKFLFSALGAKPRDLDKLVSLLDGLATNRMTRAQGVLNRFNTDKKGKSNKPKADTGFVWK